MSDCTIPSLSKEIMSQLASELIKSNKVGFKKGNTLKTISAYKNQFVSEVALRQHLTTAKDKAVANKTSGPVKHDSKVDIRVEAYLAKNKASEPILKPKTPTSQSTQEYATKRLPEVANKSASKHTPKELVKTKVATQFIGEGKKDSSTDKYKGVYDEINKANTGEYAANDIVFIASNGRRTGAVLPVVNGELNGEYVNIDSVIAADATIIMDTQEHLTKTGSYNVGELLLVKYLTKNGYVRVGTTGVWKSKASAQTTEYTTKLNEVVETLYDKDIITKMTPEESLWIVLSKSDKIASHVGDSIYLPDFEGAKKLLETNKGADLKALIESTKKARLKFIENAYSNIDKDAKTKLINEVNSIKYTTVKVVALGQVNRNLKDFKSGTKEHELLHAITSDFLTNQEALEKAKKTVDPAYIRLLELRIIVMDHVRKNPDSALNKNDYWKTDTHEFVSEVLSKPEYMAELAKINVKGTQTKGSLFEEFIQILKDILGSFDKASVTGELLNVLTQIIDAKLPPKNVSVKDKETDSTSNKEGATVQVIKGLRGNTPVKSNQVNVMRRSGTEHYGNPFMKKGVKGYTNSEGKSEFIQTNLDNNAVTNLYKAWLLGKDVEFKDINGKTLNTKNIKPKQRAWIIKQIQDGKLDNKQLMYFQDTEVNHAKALAKIVNNRKKETVRNAKSTPNDFKDGDTINLFSQIAVDGGHITLNFSPEGEFNDGPTMPGTIKKGSTVKVVKYGTHKDSDMEYDVVYIEKDGEKFYEQADGRPYHITRFVNKENGIKPFMTGLDAQKRTWNRDNVDAVYEGTAGYATGKYNAKYDKSKHTLNDVGSKKPESGDTSFADIIKIGFKESEIFRQFMQDKEVKKAFKEESNFEYDPTDTKIILPKSTSKNAQRIVEALEHEIEHYKTVAYMADKKDTPLMKKYIGLFNKIKADETIRKRIPDGALYIYDHIFNNKNGDTHGLAEMVAIAKSNEKAIEAIYKATQAPLLRRLVNKIKELVSKNKVKHTDVNLNELKTAIKNISKNGEKYGQIFQKETVDYYGTNPFLDTKDTTVYKTPVNNIGIKSEVKLNLDDIIC